MNELKEGCTYWECKKCGAIIEVNQYELIKKYAFKGMYIPDECYEVQGGCGRKSRFRRLDDDWLKREKGWIDKRGTGDVV